MKVASAAREMKMAEELVTLERIRAMAQSIIYDANETIAEVGEAGAHEEVQQRAVALRVLAAMEPLK